MTSSWILGWCFADVRIYKSKADCGGCSVHNSWSVLHMLADGYRSDSAFFDNGLVRVYTSSIICSVLAIAAVLQLAFD